jgi:uncharacterized protein YbbK (DUF523 family)/uncharacterized protein YbgA (DUF1722 family)
VSGGAAIRVGVSSCLLGEAVRHDGGHKHDRFVTDVLGEYVEWVPVCPELEAGLGVPRPAMQLVREGDAVRMRETQSRRDHTRTMQRFAARRLRALRSEGLCGYVLKRDSPSCGMARVDLFRGRGVPAKKGTGLFARALMDALPELPVEEEGRLSDLSLRENFIERIFAYQRLTDLFSGRWTSGRVIAFQTAHKLQLMAHSSGSQRALDRLVADVSRMPRPEFRAQYRAAFMAALSRVASRGKITEVLCHAARHLGKSLSRESRNELAALIDDYRGGLVPLIVPVTLLRHHTRIHEVAYLDGQTFLSPDPRERMLRNHV